MLNERLTIARKVHSELIPAEELAHATLTQFMQLGLTICQAHTDAGLHHHTAQVELEEITAAISLAGQARTRLINAHRALAQTRTEFLPGVPTRMFGDNWVCPPAQAQSKDDLVSHLQAVS